MTSGVSQALPLLDAWTAHSVCGHYRSENGNTTMLVTVLDDRLTLVAPGALNPYAARLILERRKNLQAPYDGVERVRRRPVAH